MHLPRWKRGSGFRPGFSILDESSRIGEGSDVNMGGRCFLRSFDLSFLSLDDFACFAGSLKDEVEEDFDIMVSFFVEAGFFGGFSTVFDVGARGGEEMQTSGRGVANTVEAVSMSDGLDDDNVLSHRKSLNCCSRALRAALVKFLQCLQDWG